MAIRSKADYNLYEINGGYKKPSRRTKLAIQIGKIDTSWMEKIELTDDNGNTTYHHWREPGVLRKYFKSQLEKE